MARMRTLKPEAATSESLAEVDRGTRWTFALFWTHCDDDGRAAYNLRLIKSAIYPLDDGITPVVLAAEFDELERVGAVCRYEVGGKPYVHVPAFGEHQHPNRRVDSKLPPCPKMTHPLPTHSQSSEPAVSPPEPVTSVVVGEGRGEVGGDGEGRARSAARGARLPENWTPPIDLINEMRAEGIPDELARRELRKFRDHWAAQPGAKGRKVDWPATWRNWLRRSAEFTPDRASPGESTTDRRVRDGLALVEQLRAEELAAARKEITG